jgi:hypothetical protein
MSREALKLALKALTPFSTPNWAGTGVDKANEAITAIKQALAAPAAQPAPVQGPDWKAEYLKSVESGCITLDELREALAELDATNRQVEILSDALAESRREVAALKAVQEPVALRPEDVTVEVLMVQSGGGFAPLKTHGVKLTHKPTGIVVQCSSERSQHRNREQALRDLERYLHGARPQPTPPAQPAVPDVLTQTYGENYPREYVQGWNDCRAEMLEGMKP